MAAEINKSDIKHTKGILKNAKSFEKGDGTYATEKPDKEMKWDEMNILATYHPADKDYGHQKITDPPTPFSRLSEEEKSGDEGELFDSNVLAERLQKKTKAKIVARAERSDDDDDEEDEDLTPEERAKKLEFERKRKLHYNEFQAVKLRQQMHSEDDEEDEGDASGGGEKLKGMRGADADDMKDSEEGMMVTDSSDTAMDSSSPTTKHISQTDRQMSNVDDF